MRIHLQSLHGVAPSVWLSSEGDVMADFGGLFMAMSKDEARAFAGRLSELAGEGKPVVVPDLIQRGNADLEEAA